MIYRRDKALSRAALGFIEVVLEFAKQAEVAAAAERPGQSLQAVG
jgi:hypothetical protein